MALPTGSTCPTCREIYLPQTKLGIYNKYTKASETFNQMYGDKKQQQTKQTNKQKTPKQVTTTTTTTAVHCYFFPNNICLLLTYSVDVADCSWGEVIVDDQVDAHKIYSPSHYISTDQDPNLHRWTHPQPHPHMSCMPLLKLLQRTHPSTWVYFLI